MKPPKQDKCEHEKSCKCGCRHFCPTCKEQVQYVKKYIVTTSYPVTPRTEDWRDLIRPELYEIASDVSGGHSFDENSIMGVIQDLLNKEKGKLQAARDNISRRMIIEQKRADNPENPDKTYVGGKFIGLRCALEIVDELLNKK